MTPLTVDTIKAEMHALVAELGPDFADVECEYVALMPEDEAVYETHPELLEDLLKPGCAVGRMLLRAGVSKAELFALSGNTVDGLPVVWFADGPAADLATCLQSLNDGGEQWGNIAAEADRLTAIEED